MMARVRARLTYANVVATLALFVALGGTGYAASQITSRDVKNRSLKGGDLKKDTLGGAEVNESKLGSVPQAGLARNSLTAANATVADLARNSDRATSAGVAGVADVANDARALAGQGAAAFEQSSRTQFAGAPLTPSGPPDERTVLSWPEMGIALRTSSVGCPADKIRLRLRKTSGPYVSIYEEGVQKGTLVGGQDVSFCSAADNVWDGALAEQTGRTLFFRCLGVDNAELRCIGTRSQP
jgi:hypothetical protein